MKAVAAAFNPEKALVGAFSVIATLRVYLCFQLYYLPLQDDPTVVEVTGARLWSRPQFPLYPGEHYCDLLSPYRALEWVYIESLRHTMQFS